MQQILYSSRLRPEMGPSDIADILKHARRRNADRGISGVLALRGPLAFQVLEGPPDDVAELLDRIASDPRHGAFRVLLDRHPRARQFAGCSMGLLSRHLPMTALCDPATLVDRLASWIVDGPATPGRSGRALDLPCRSGTVRRTARIRGADDAMPGTARVLPIGGNPAHSPRDRSGLADRAWPTPS